MSNLQQIAARHRADRWTNIVFIAGAALLVALSIGAVTKHSAGPVRPREWTLTVVEGPLEVADAPALAASP